MKLRHVIIFAIIAFVPQASSRAQAPWTELYLTYYADADFTVWVGEVWSNLNCAGENGSVGTTSSYRKWERFGCIQQDGICRCQQLINGYWQFIDCPPAVASGCDA
jgi:hypothetical protein